MINIPLNKILFLDIETVGIEPNWDSLTENRPELAFQFTNYFDWFQKRFPEDADKPIGQMFVNRAALVAEFSRIVCVSVAFVTDDGQVKMQSFSDVDEKVLLKGVQKLLYRVGELGFFLCGHNVKGFDIPVLAKRMLMNGLKPPKLLPGHDTKPWEIKALDTKELWQYGGYGSIASLELMCVCMGVESPKTMEVTGNKVHEAFWVDKNIEGIVKYCEKDVKVLIDVIKKFYELEV
jgi:predicted PolB exonuclease-like 3'-5' exonuclease